MKKNAPIKSENYSNISKSNKAGKKTADKKKDKSFFKFIKFFLIFILVISAIIAFIVFSGFFNVNEIIVEGNSKVAKEQVISRSQIELGTNIFFISNKEIENGVIQISYIENAKMHRVLPNKIKINVNERKVDYIAVSDSKNMYIDKNGNILEFTNDNSGYIVISGFSSDFSNLKLNDSLNEKDINNLKIIERIIEVANENELNNLINKIEILDSGEYILNMDSISKVVHLGNEENLNTKFLYVKAILSEQEGKKGEIFVNVNLDNEYVYFRENI